MENENLPKPKKIKHLTKLYKDQKQEFTFWEREGELVILFIIQNIIFFAGMYILHLFIS